ncbi:MAG: hypothetical protein ACRDI1_06835, partial [Actinomycetota bacterium]
MFVVFGISWRNVKWPKAASAALGIALALSLLGTPVSGGQTAASELVSVIVREAPGAGAAPELLIEDAGGSVGLRLEIIDG